MELELNEHRLEVQEFVDAVFRAFAADAGFLDAAEGGDFRGDEACVHADHAELQALADAPGAGEIAREGVGGEARAAVVGEAECVLLGLEADEAGDRAEGFLTGEERVGSDIAEDGGLIECAAVLVAVGAGKGLRAMTERIGDVSFDLLERLLVDERALLRDAGEAIPDCER